MRNARDRGTAAIELALVLLIILLLAIGTFEWGTGFADRINLASSVREGARVGAAAGDYYVNFNDNADCSIIEASAGALNELTGNTVRQLYIYESDVNGTFDSTMAQIYRPQQPGDVGLVCGGAWYPIQQSWPPGSRVTTGAARDWLGVRVQVDHAWKTGFLWWNGTVTWNEDAIVHLEPKVVN